MVYISPMDKGYDNVFVTTSENENFKFDFVGQITKQKEIRAFRYPKDLVLENPKY